MTPWYFDNLVHWTGQVVAIISIGLVLAHMLRMRHPRRQLLFCHFLLIASLLLPAIQPWHHPLILVRHRAASAATQAQIAPSRNPSPPGTPWQANAIWVLAAGAAAKLCWLAMGLWRVRRYRASATPLVPVPAAVQEAKKLTRADAMVCASAEAPGPVTVGWFNPIILLPESFLALSGQAQVAIACHELLHVRRRDWLVTIFEEIAGALLWFNPAIWWLLGRTRLLREQVVDEKVVRLTNARESYLDALMAMAGSLAEPDMAPATAFLKRRNLTHRIHALLKGVDMSNQRLVLSYSCLALALALGGWCTVTALPLVGRAQVTEAAATDAPGVSVDTGGAVLHRATVPYPIAARKQGVEGTVIAELTLNQNGEVSDAKILSGPEELRAGVLWSVLQWHYAMEGDSGKTVHVTVNFAVPSSTPQTPPNPQTEALGNSTVPHGTLISIDFSGLPDPLRSEVWEKVKGFQGQPFSNHLMRQIEAALQGTDDHLGLRWWDVKDKDKTEHVLTIFVSPRFGHTPESQEPAQFPPTGNARVLMGEDAAAAKLVHKVDPVYPPQAQAEHISGIVVLDVVIAPNGTVSNIRAASGPPELVPAAMEAVRQWTYRPTTINGTAVEVQTRVAIPFPPVS